MKVSGLVVMRLTAEILSILTYSAGMPWTWTWISYLIGVKAETPQNTHLVLMSTWTSLTLLAWI